MNEAPQDVRTRILAAAFDLLSEHGVATLTQPQVAKAAGVRTSHLTYYFPTRNDLLFAIARHACQMLATGFKEDLARAPGKSSVLAKAFGDVVSTQRLARLMLGLIVTSDEDRAIKAPLRELIANERAHIRNVVGSAGLSADDDVLPVCHALLVGAAVLNLARDDAAAESEARGIARFIVDELLARPGKVPSKRSRSSGKQKTKRARVRRGTRAAKASR